MRRRRGGMDLGPVARILGMDMGPPGNLGSLPYSERAKVRDALFATMRTEARAIRAASNARMNLALAECREAAKAPPRAGLATRAHLREVDMRLAAVTASANELTRKLRG